MLMMLRTFGSSQSIQSKLPSPSRTTLARSMDGGAERELAYLMKNDTGYDILDTRLVFKAQIAS
jgi:hypothetical protein